MIHLSSHQKSRADNTAGLEVELHSHLDDAVTMLVRDLAKVVSCLLGKAETSGRIADSVIGRSFPRPGRNTGGERGVTRCIQAKVDVPQIRVGESLVENIK